MFTNTGRFVYARYKSYARCVDALDDMCAEGEMSPSEAKIERVNDHNGRLRFWAVTIA